MTFGQKIKILRQERDLTIEQMVTDINRKYQFAELSKSLVSKYENDKHQPSRFQIVAAFADYFDVNIDWLMELSENKYKEVSNANCKQIPILGDCAAGLPIFAHENIQDYLNIDNSIDVDFALKIKGDSMINARIYDGDIVLVRKQSDVENGEIAIVLIGDEATCKKVFKYNGMIVLKAENPEYAELIYKKSDMKDIKILGKVVKLIGDVK